MAEKWIVLRPTAPMQIGNEVFRLKQGQVAKHPGVALDPAVIAEFNSFKEAQAFADEGAGLYNQKVREGVTTLKSLEKKKAASARDPNQADRQAAIENAKVLTNTENGLQLQDPAAQRKYIAELEAQLAEAKSKVTLVDTGTFLEKKTRDVAKSVKKAAKKGIMTKEEISTLIEAESQGKARKGVLDGLKSILKDDAIFGKLFKK